jgi:hypothetical protein
MIPPEALRDNAKRKLASAKREAEQNPDDAAYLAGYVVELCLKANIVEHLNLSGWPEGKAEFQSNKQTRKLKIHDLDKLLALSGLEAEVKTNHMSEWSICATWRPEFRYNIDGTTSIQQANLLVEAAEKLFSVL